MNKHSELFIILGTIVTIFFSHTWANLPKQLLSSPREFPTSKLHHADVSPDGRYIALSVDAPIGSSSFRKSTIWLFDRKTNLWKQATQITDDMKTGDVNARWSPDGKRILFVSDRGDRIGIYFFDVESESVEKIHELQGNEDVWWYQSIWNPNGKKVLYPDSDSVGNQNLHLIDIRTGEISKFTDYVGKAISFPSWSPNGRFVAYSVKDTIGELSKLMQFDTELNVTKELHSGDALYAYPRWNYDGKWLTYHNFYRGNFRINLLDVDQRRKVEVATLPGHRSWGPTWDSDKDVLVFQQEKIAERTVEIYSLEDDSTWKVTDIRPLFFDWESKARHWATWSGDSDKVSFFSSITDSRPDTSFIIATVSTQNVSTVESFEKDPQYLIAPVWSQFKDGYVYPIAGRSGYSVKFEGWPEKKSEILFSSERVITLVTITSDEEIIAYVAHATGEQNNQDVWIFDRISETNYQVTFRNSPIEMLSISPNGENIVFKSGNDLLLVDTYTNEIHELARANFWLGAGHAWIKNDKIIFEAVEERPPVKLYEYQVAERTTKPFLVGDEFISNPITDPTNDRIIYYTLGKDLMKMDTVSGTTKVVLSNVINAVLSNDGSRIIYQKQGKRTPTSIWSIDVSQYMRRKLP